MKAAISSAERQKAKQATTEEFGHDRKETRTAIVAPVRDMAEEHNFPGLKAVARITSKRGRDKTVERYFLLTQCYTPAELLRIVRQHWGIETSCTGCSTSSSTRIRREVGKTTLPPTSPFCGDLPSISLALIQIQRPRCADLVARQTQMRGLGRQFPRRYALEHPIALPFRGG
jgi:hypothetical protein